MASPCIILNGSEHCIDGIGNVSDLLASLNLKGKPIIVELDGIALLPREFEQTPLIHGNRVEIISIVAGG